MVVHARARLLSLLKGVLIASISGFLSCSNQDVKTTVNESVDKIVSFIGQVGNFYYNDVICVDSVQVNEDIVALVFYNGTSDDAKSVVKKGQLYIFNRTDFVIIGDSVKNRPHIDEIWTNEFEVICFINIKTNNYRVVTQVEGIPDFQCIEQLQDFINHPDRPFKEIEGASIDSFCVEPPPPFPKEDILPNGGMSDVIED